ncbi:hypothetical protein C817_03115 [Dorea sp. 5-2]|nr:hypothetical protein C817_03115 [Dorea sp. 5-2]
MKKILHIFRVEKFTEEFINFINNNFYKESHFFWIHGDKFLEGEYGYLKYSNVEYFPQIDIKLRKEFTKVQLDKFDLIIYHWVIDNSVMEFFFDNKKYLKKLVLYFWGGDKKLTGKWMDNIKKRFVVNNAVGLVTIIPEEIKDILAAYRPKGKLLYAMYDNEKMRNALVNMEVLKRGENDTINIQIGNSAYPEFNHINILKLLSKYKKENIKIYVPLSYGITEYAKQVIDVGIKIFGEKFVALQEFIPSQEYYSLLQKMDVVIMDVEKQHALGNIFVLMESGCKVYFCKNSMLHHFFSKEMQCIVYSTEQIRGMVFKELFEFSDAKKQYNRKKIRENWNKNAYVIKWQEIFDI